jgi:opacity protein-like surface antigen
VIDTTAARKRMGRRLPASALLEQALDGVAEHLEGLGAADEGALEAAVGARLADKEAGRAAHAGGAAGLEVTYGRNGFDEIDWSHFSKSGSFETKGDVASLAFMANVFWDIDTGTRITPSVGTGLGVVQVTFDDLSDADGPLFDETETGLGFQLGAGLGYALTEALKLSLDYRFFVASVSPTADPGQPSIGGEEFNIEYTNSSFWLGLRYHF